MPTLVKVFKVMDWVVAIVGPILFFGLDAYSSADDGIYLIGACMGVYFVLSKVVVALLGLRMKSQQTTYLGSEQEFDDLERRR